MKKPLKTAFLIAIPLGVVMAFLLRDRIIGFIDGEGGCPLWLLTGNLCPGCGNTRSLYCLLHFRPIAALRNNPAMPFMFICLMLFYGELAADAAGHPVKLIPRRESTVAI